MWDKIFTASLAAYSVSLAVFLLGHHIFELYPMTMIGAALLGVTAVATGVSGLVLALSTKTKT